MLTLNLPGSFVDQVTLLARSATRKDKSLASTRATLSSTHASLCVVQRDLESICLKNASLVQFLNKCSATSDTTISESFENALQQVDNFYHSSPYFKGSDSAGPDAQRREGRIPSGLAIIPLSCYSICCKV